MSRLNEDGDLLFADPLGIRKSKMPCSGDAHAGHHQVPIAYAQYCKSRIARLSARQPEIPKGYGGYAYDASEDLDLNLPQHRSAEIRADRETHHGEDTGLLSAWLGHIFGVGTQCFSARDKTMDAEEAKKAAKTGRPPAAQQKPFPAPRVSTEPNGYDHQGVDTISSSGAQNAPAEPDTLAPPKEDASTHASHGAPHGFASEPPPPPQAQWTPSQQVEERQPQVPPSRSQEIESKPSPSIDSTRQGERASSKDMPQKKPCTKESIEVYVVEKEGEEGRWCEAEPKFRVLDKGGRDLYVCAEYEWDGEFHVRDFSPRHVRERGQEATACRFFSYYSSDQ